MSEHTAEKDMSCAVCDQPVGAVRPPMPGRVLAHGSCLGQDVLIVEFRPDVDYILPPDRNAREGT